MSVDTAGGLSFEQAQEMLQDAIARSSSGEATLTFDYIGDRDPITVQ